MASVISLCSTANDGRGNRCLDFSECADQGRKIGPAYFKTVSRTIRNAKHTSGTGIRIYNYVIIYRDCAAVAEFDTILTLITVIPHSEATGAVCFYISFRLQRLIYQLFLQHQ